LLLLLLLPSMRVRALLLAFWLVYCRCCGSWRLLLLQWFWCDMSEDLAAAAAAALHRKPNLLRLSLLLLLLLLLLLTS
jgi:hypothetical protein